MTTTFGTGELLKAAMADGCRKIWLAVGGSATVDGGVGAAMALGWRFLDEHGSPVAGTGGSVSAIRELIPPSVSWPDMDVLADVTHPFCGPMGAAHVFGPQKGATPEMVERLDRGLCRLAALLDRRGTPVHDLPGSGAAGGLAGGAVAFFGARIVPGIDRIMEVCGLDRAAASSDWILTGEGLMDSTSLKGKVISGLVSRTRSARARVAVVAGDIRLSEADWRAAGVDRAVAMRRDRMTVEASMRNARVLLRERVVELARGFLRDSARPA